MTRVRGRVCPLCEHALPGVEVRILEGLRRRGALEVTVVAVFAVIFIATWVTLLTHR